MYTLVDIFAIYCIDSSQLILYDGSSISCELFESLKN